MADVVENLIYPELDRLKKLSDDLDDVITYIGFCDWNEEEVMRLKEEIKEEYGDYRDSIETTHFGHHGISRALHSIVSAYDWLMDFDWLKDKPSSESIEEDARDVVTEYLLCHGEWE